MTTERELRKRLAAVNATAAELCAELDGFRRRRRVLCRSCGRRTVVSALTYIQTHFYISPYSCTGGDYWKEGEGQFDCPKCGARNRLYDRPDVVALKRYFAAVVKEHER